MRVRGKNKKNRMKNLNNEKLEPSTEMFTKA